MAGFNWQNLAPTAGLVTVAVVWILGLYGLYGLARLGLWLRAARRPARRGGRSWLR